jgi:hypothetical protein
MKRMLVVGAAIVMTNIFANQPAQAQSPSYVTIQFGRAQQGGCTTTGKPIPGFETLAETAQDMLVQGALTGHTSMPGTAAVVVKYATEAADRCSSGGFLYADWADLKALHTTYGWQAISASQTYDTHLATDPPATQFAQTCATLPEFQAEGFDSAWGLFAWPDATSTVAMQLNPVSTCFAYGRQYATGGNYEADVQSPWFQNSANVEGGRCNDSTQPCYPIAKGQLKRRYENPATFESLLTNETLGEWVDLQFYRLVTGAGSSGKVSWDCTSPNWEDHWTSQLEIYCQNDFDAILHAIQPSAVVTDPATVATSWGRVP